MCWRKNRGTEDRRHRGGSTYYKNYELTQEGDWEKRIDLNRNKQQQKLPWGRQYQEENSDEAHQKKRS